MSEKEIVELVSLGIGTMLAALVASIVTSDARKRGLSSSDSLAWGIGVFLMMAVVLPIYLIVRRKQETQGGATPKVETAPCPYCGYLNKPGSTFCDKCQRQLKSSSEIHKR